MNAVSVDILVGQEDDHGEKVDSPPRTDGPVVSVSELGARHLKISNRRGEKNIKLPIKCSTVSI